MENMPLSTPPPSPHKGTSCWLIGIAWRNPLRSGAPDLSRSIVSTLTAMRRWARRSAASAERGLLLQDFFTAMVFGMGGREKL